MKRFESYRGFYKLDLLHVKGERACLDKVSHPFGEE